MLTEGERDGWSNRPLTIYRRVKYTQERILKITNPKPKEKYDSRIKVESNDGAVEGINLFDAQLISAACLGRLVNLVESAVKVYKAPRLKLYKGKIHRLTQPAIVDDGKIQELT